MHFLIGVINIIFERNIIEQVVLEKKNNFIADATKVKHTSITLFTMIIKMDNLYKSN